MAFLETELGPQLRPGDVVVMDGPRIHRVAGVQEVIEKKGAKVLYLPPYSPELNPIEWAWSWLKRTLRKAPPRKVDRLLREVDRIWKMITTTLCKAWIRGCGYKVST